MWHDVVLDDIAQHDCYNYSNALFQATNNDQNNKLCTPDNN